MESTQGFDRFADGLPVGLLRVDGSGRCRFINATACDILGLGAREASDLGWLRSFRQTDADLILRTLTPGPTGDALSAEISRDGNSADGATMVSLRTALLPTGRDGSTEYALVLMDITWWQRAALALQGGAGRMEERVLTGEGDLRERLTHLTRVSTLGEMASSIAHEVNQPLTAVATYAQACRRLLETGEAGTDEAREVLGRIAREALRAGDIIHRLKDLVRHHESRWREEDLNALVRDVEPLARGDARLHDVRLSLELAPDLPTVLADAVQIQQVVLNLIRNGIDAVEEAAPHERFVRVRTRSEASGTIRLSVEDPGGGVSVEAERHLFQPFFTTKGGGMGMGLSISRSIVEAHHGRIGFQRRTGGGSTFYFTLPALGTSRARSDR
jgi:two-component system sensor histidine kinase DctS